MKKREITDIIVATANDLSEEQIRETIASYSKNAASYAKMWVWNPQYRDELSTQVKKFHRFVESGARVLVAGAGTGRDLEMLVDEGFECTALDISPQIMAEAKSRGIPAKYIVHDLRKHLPFADDLYDAVYCDSAVEHLPKREMADILREFYRILKPHGVLYIGVKRGDGEVYYRYDIGNDRDRRFYTTYQDVEFHRLMVEAGFVMLEAWIDDHMDLKTHQWLAGIFRKNS